MKLNKLSLDLLQYLRANLVFSFEFNPPEIRQKVTVSTPVDAAFECHILSQAVGLLESMIKTKFATTYEQDLELLDDL